MTVLWKEELKRLVRGDVLEEALLGPFTTIRAGGPAEILVHPQDPEDLKHVYRIAHEAGIPVTILGKGSNLLVADKGIRGIVLRLVSSYFTELKLLPGQQIYAGAGSLKSELLAFSLEQGLVGLEFSTGIPGDIGGALQMNAGTKYGAYADCLREVTLFHPETLELSSISDASVKSSYRHQTYLGQAIACSASFQLRKGDVLAARREVARIMAERAEKQPLDVPNFGSAFKNPNPELSGGASSGRLIERAGLKGVRVGGAEVSLKHANFLVNAHGATATDLLTLICLVQEKVFQQFHVWLEPEVKLFGDHPFLPASSPPKDRVILSVS